MNTKTSYAWRDIHYLKWLAGFCPYYKIQACSKRHRYVLCKNNGWLEFLGRCRRSCRQKFGRYKLKQNIKGLYKFCVLKFLFDKSPGSSSTCRDMRPCKPQKQERKVSPMFLCAGLSKPYSLPSVFGVCSAMHDWFVEGGLREIRASSLATDQAGCHRP